MTNMFGSKFDYTTDWRSDPDCPEGLKELCRTEALRQAKEAADRERDRLEKIAQEEQRNDAIDKCIIKLLSTEHARRYGASTLEVYATVVREVFNTTPDEVDELSLTITVEFIADRLLSQRKIGKVCYDGLVRTSYYFIRPNK